MSTFKVSSSHDRSSSVFSSMNDYADSMPLGVSSSLSRMSFSLRMSASYCAFCFSCLSTKFSRTLPFLLSLLLDFDCMDCFLLVNLWILLL